jgi:hypothetical protein
MGFGGFAVGLNDLFDEGVPPAALGALAQLARDHFAALLAHILADRFRHDLIIPNPIKTPAELPSRSAGEWIDETQGAGIPADINFFPALDPSWVK